MLFTDGISKDVNKTLWSETETFDFKSETRPETENFQYLLETETFEFRFETETEIFKIETEACELYVSL